MKPMRLGILGGSFDPVHHGHLILARAALEELKLDRVLFVLASMSPHKTNAKISTPDDRMNMLRLAIADEPNFEASDIELDRPAPSYTVDTLRELSRLQPDAELVLLIGADNVEKFPTWREPDEIARLARIAVLDRGGVNSPHSWPVVRRSVDISSTDIRQRVSAGLSIRYLTPDAVCDYIRRQGLYRTSDTRL